MINFSLLIDLFIPDWPIKKKYNYIEIKNKIYFNLSTHYDCIPKILKIALNVIFIFFIFYFLIIKVLYFLTLRKIDQKKLILFFFKISKITNNFERFFRSLICLYFYEIIDKNLINE